MILIDYELEKALDFFVQVPLCARLSNFLNFSAKYA